MKKITLIMLVALVPLMTMAQKKSKKGKKGKIEKVDNSNATYEFMVLTGFEITKGNDPYKKGTAEIQIKNKMKAAQSKVKFNFDFGTDSQENRELMKNAISYSTMASAVNALANNGWEFVNANVVDLGTSRTHYYYMIRSK